MGFTTAARFGVIMLLCITILAYYIKLIISMKKYYKMMESDVRFEEGFKSCMNCGVCTAICPAAEFYDYDPRQIVSTVQTQNDRSIEELLKSETIWYCGECMSCKPRCPRGNTPGAVIQALRTLSQELGFFVESEKGRQQLALKRVIGQNILDTGYCIIPKLVAPEMHPEQGAVWEWIYNNDKDVFDRFTENYRQAGAGAMRMINEDCLDEVRKIFEVTGGNDFFDKIEEHSKRAAEKMGMDSDSDEYIQTIYTTNNGEHSRS